MSTTIDQRVVEMRFDNKQFESNVATSMSTLDKLKAKLKFGDSAKSFENIGKAASSVDMRGLGAAVDTVKARFSALDVVAVTALANITNSAVNTAKRMTAALTIEPIKSGFHEYETQLNSVQTILANTKSKGSNIDDVNRALATLNEYADQTIYNFTEMTRNIGTFTAAGVDLQTSVDSIRGIANLAAMSGSSSQQASSAMYQLSQALAAGRVSLMDWNSVVNAGMGGEQFQNALIRTSELLKTGAKDAIKTYGSFRESLTQGEWLTTEVLTETLKQLSGAYSEAELISQGFTEKQAKDIAEMAKTASEAATKVKTFTQLWDVMKESAQSGWAQTWQIIIGDFEEAKEFFTPIAEALTGIIEKTSDLRNNMLGEIFSSPWEQLSNKVEDAGLSVDDFLAKIEKNISTKEVEKLTEEYGSLTGALKKGKVPANVLNTALNELLGSEEKVTKETKDLGDVVDKVMNGEFGDGEERIKKLTEAGYDWAAVQNAVNEKLGVNVKHAERLTETQKAQAESLSKLSDEQLKQKGMTDEQIEALRELEAAAEDSNTSLGQLIKNIDKPSGRTLFIEACSNALKFMGQILGEVKKAWDEVFKKEDGEKSFGDRIYDIIEKIHEFTEELDFSGEKAENFRKVMEGIFTGLSIGNYLLSTSLVAGLKILAAVLDLFGTDLGELAAKIADIIIKFKDWVTENTLFYDTINKTAEIIAALISGVGDLINAFMGLEIFADIAERIKQALIDLFDQLGLTFSGFSVEDIVGNISEAFQNAVNWIKGLDTNEVGRNFVMGLVNGIMSGISMAVEAIVNIGKAVINAIMGIWQEHSPSKVAHEIGENFIIGLVNGIKEGAAKLWEAIKAVADKVIEVFKNIDWGQLFAAGIIIAAMFLFKKLIDVFDKLVSPLEAVTGMLKKFGGMAESIGDYFDAKKTEVKANAILKYGIAIGILAASVYLLSGVRWQDLLKATVTIAALAGVLVLLSVAMSKLNSIGSLGVSTGAILAIGVALTMIASVLVKLSEIPEASIPVIFKTILMAVGSIVAVMAAMALLSKLGGEYALRAGGMMVLMSVALLAMAGVLKAASSLATGDPAALDVAGKIVAQVVVLYGIMMVLSKFAGKNAIKAGIMMQSMSLALLGMLGVIKIASKLAEDPQAVQNGIKVVGQMMLLFGVIMAASALVGKNAAKAGGMILMMSLGLMAMVSTIKMLEGVSDKSVQRGIDILLQLEIMFGLLMVVSKFAGSNAAKAGAMLLLMSGAMLVLAVVIHILEGIPATNLKNAIMAISALMVVFGILIASTHLAKNVKAELVVLTVAVGMLSAFLMALSFIPEDDIKRATACLSAIIGVFAVLVAVTKLVPNDKGLAVKLGVLIVAVGILTGLVYLLASIEDPSRAIAATEAICDLMLAFSAAIGIISLTSKNANMALPAMALMTGVVAALAIVIYALANMPNPEAALPVAEALSLLLLAFAAAFALISATAPVANAALPALAVMAAVVAGLALLLYALSNIPNPEVLLPIAQGLSLLLVAMSAASLLLIPIGAFGPAALTGVAVLAGIMAGLGSIAIIFGELMRLIPQDKIDTWKEGINKLMDLLSTLSYGLGEVVGSFVGGLVEGSLSFLPTLGTQLSDFMTNAKPFIDGIKGIDEGAIAGVKTLAGVILALTAADIIDGLTSWITGGVSFADFGVQLGDFGNGVKAFADSVSGINAESFTASVKAAKALVEVAQAIPSDGLLGLDGIDDFGKNVVKFAGCMNKYAAEVAELNITAISGSIGAAKSLISIAKLIPDDGLTGMDGIDDFGRNVKSFGKSLAKYSKEVADVDTGKINSSISAAKTILSFIKSTSGLDTTGVKSFTTALNTLATANFSGVTAALSKNMGQFNVAGNNMMVAMSKGAKAGQSSFATAITQVVEAGIKRIDAKKAAFNKAGIELMDRMIKGVNSKKSQASRAFTTIASACVDALRAKYSSFSTAGKYLVQGFAAGISANAYMATAKARAMALAAKLAAEAALGVQSPSKVFYQIGKYLVMGFANAIGDYTSMASDATTDMAHSATDGMRTALGKIGDALSGDLDFNPTIRPVMDLSEVTAGAASINSMFGNPAISAMGGFNSVSASMRRLQNGFTNEDVVSAINKLRKEVGSISKPSYNIGGINYNDDVDVANAINTLVRATKINRRS